MERLLREKGHSVLVFSTRDPRNRKSLQSPFYVEKIDYNRSDIPLRQKVKFALRLIYSFDAARKMDALLQNEKPDIAHLHNFCHQISPSILPVLRKHGVPIVHTLHDLKLACPNYWMLSPRGICEKCRGNRYYNAILQRCVKGSLSFSVLNCLEAYLHKVTRIYDIIDLYISPSNFCKEKLSSFGVNGRRIRVLPNFLELEDKPPTSSRGYMLYCGRLLKEKGLLTLLKAVRAVPHAQLVIAGSGPQDTPIRNYIRQNKMSNVQLVGFVTGHRRTQLMQQASFFVVPSECYENCSLSVLEAFSFGKPVVASRIGGIPEQVKPGFTGLLFEPGDPDDLRDRIRHLISHPQDVSRMGNNARKTAEEAYSPEVHYHKLMEIYQEAIALRRRTIAGRRTSSVPRTNTGR